MRRKGNLRGLSRLISVLLAFSLLSGLCVQAAAQGPGGAGAISLLQAQTYALDAKEGAQADKNILAFALREAQKVVDSGLLDELAPSAPDGLKERFEAAITRAEAIYDKADATSSEIQGAYLELQEVMWLLSYVKADTTALQAAADHAETIDLSAYTEDSVSAFQEALAAVKALLERDDLNMGHQEQMEAAIQSLETAESQLVLRPVESTMPELPEIQPSNPQPSDPQPSDPQPSDDPNEDDEKKPDTPPIKYNDVPSDAWYAQSVEYVSSLGIMNGTGNEQFSPQGSTSRAMIWTMLYRLAGEPEQGEDSAVWYDKAMRWVQENGISDGSSPNGTITREQLAVTLYRYAGSVKTDFDLSAYRDGAEISGWAQEGMMWAVETGLINGKGDGILDPKGMATRAEAATIFMRFMQNVQDSKEEAG